MKKAYLILGLHGVGKTTFGRKRATEENGVCLSFDDFFYNIIDPQNPDIYSFRPNRVRSAIRWFWLQLKMLCETSVSPIYIDQLNYWSEHTIKTAGFLEHRYDYEVELVEPDSPMWTDIKPLLKDKEKHKQELKLWALHIANASPHYVTFEKVMKDIENWKEFTIDDLLKEY
jgi:hypothetical protein